MESTKSKQKLGKVTPERRELTVQDEIYIFIWLVAWGAPPFLEISVDKKFGKKSVMLVKGVRLELRAAKNFSWLENENTPQDRKTQRRSPKTYM